MGVLKVWDGTAWRTIGCGTGANTGRLKLWDGTQWVRERCDDETTGIFDTFNRTANTSSLGTSDSGHVWTAVNGTWGISNPSGIDGAAHMFSSGTQAIAVVETGLADCTLELDVASAFVNGGGLSWRVIDNNNHWFWDIDGSIPTPPYGGSVYKRVGGALTQVRTGLASANFKRMGVVLSGSTITLQVDGVTIDTITDATHSTATKHGLRDFGGSADFRNFSVNGAAPVIARPLKLWDGTDWVTVACMVPA